MILFVAPLSLNFQGNRGIDRCVTIITIIIKVGIIQCDLLHDYILLYSAVESTGVNCHGSSCCRYKYHVAAQIHNHFRMAIIIGRHYGWYGLRWRRSCHKSSPTR